MVKVNISDEVLAELGKIVVIHALIEQSLANVIGTIVSLKTRQELGKIVTAELSFKQLIGTLSSLLTFALGKEHECTVEFAHIKKRLYEAEKQRNLVVHSVWAAHADPDSQVVLRIKTTAKEKAGLRTELTRFTVEEVRRITSVVGDAYGALSLFECRFQEDESANSDRSSDTA